MKARAVNDERAEVVRFVYFGAVLSSILDVFVHRGTLVVLIGLATFECVGGGTPERLAVRLPAVEVNDEEDLAMLPYLNYL